MEHLRIFPKKKLGILLLLLCLPLFSQSPKYKAEVIAGFGACGPDLLGFGPQIRHAGTNFPLPHPKGRYVYFSLPTEILEYDSVTQMVRVLAGLPYPGFADGPGHIAMFSTNTYQNGGFAVSKDGKTLYLADQQDFGGVVRIIDVATGNVSTFSKTLIPAVKSLCVGAVSGEVYVVGGDKLYKIGTDGNLSLSGAALTGYNIYGFGFYAVDEARGKLYATDRNNVNGRFAEFPISGGAGRTLNDSLVREQNAPLSDGPVSGVRFANPMCCNWISGGYIVVGDGDGRTFRRFDPDSGQMFSLCKGTDSLYYWAKGDGKNNNCFNTWPNFFGGDPQGNGYMGYSVWPLTIRFKKVS